jgi:hypothetical protein
MGTRSCAQQVLSAKEPQSAAASLVRIDMFYGRAAGTPGRAALVVGSSPRSESGNRVRRLAKVGDRFLSRARSRPRTQPSRSDRRAVELQAPSPERNACIDDDDTVALMPSATLLPFMGERPPPTQDHPADDTL